MCLLFYNHFLFLNNRFPLLLSSWFKNVYPQNEKKLIDELNLFHFTYLNFILTVCTILIWTLLSFIFCELVSFKYFNRINIHNIGMNIPIVVYYTYCTLPNVAATFTPTCKYSTNGVFLWGLEAAERKTHSNSDF